MIVIFTAPLEYSPYCISIFIVPPRNKVACSRYVQIILLSPMEVKLLQHVSALQRPTPDV